MNRTCRQILSDIPHPPPHMQHDIPNTRPHGKAILAVVHRRRIRLRRELDTRDPGRLFPPWVRRFGRGQLLRRGLVSRRTTDVGLELVLHVGEEEIFPGLPFVRYVRLAAITMRFLIDVKPYRLYRLRWRLVAWFV
jgi:hypothetical protein